MTVKDLLRIDNMAFVKPDLGSALPLVASGKVRELYNVDAKSLLFVASDRISAYDVVMENVGRPFHVMLQQFTDSDDRVFPTRVSF